MGILRNRHEKYAYGGNLIIFPEGRITLVKRLVGSSSSFVFKIDFAPKHQNIFRDIF